MKELRQHIKKIGFQNLAAQLGVRYQSIQDWLAVGRIPAERVLAVEKATGISRHVLRPDIYPLEKRQVA